MPGFVVLGVVSGGVAPGVLGVGLAPGGGVASAKGAADRSSTAASVVSVRGSLI
jgi:hypothetical protein